MKLVRAIIAFAIALILTTMMFAFVDTIPDLIDIPIYVYLGFFALCLYVLHNVIKR